MWGKFVYIENIRFFCPCSLADMYLSGTLLSDKQFILTVSYFISIS